MSGNQGNIFEEANKSNDLPDADVNTTESKPLDLAALDKSTKVDPLETTSSSDVEEKTEKTEPLSLASLSGDSTGVKKAVVPSANTDLPKLSVVPEISTGQTISVGNINSGIERAGPRVEDRGFGTGFKETGLDMVTGLTGLVTDKAKTGEQAKLDPGNGAKDNLAKAGGDLISVLGKTGNDLTLAQLGITENTKTASAIGTQLSDHFGKVMSGNKEAMGSTTAFIASLAVPGAGVAKGGTGLIDDTLRATRTVKTANSLDELMTMANRVKVTKSVTGLGDETVRAGQKVTSLSDEALRAGQKISTLGDEGLGVAAKVKPTAIQPPKPSFTTSLKNTVQGLKTRVGETVDNVINPQGSPQLQLATPGGGPVARVGLRGGDEFLGTGTRVGKAPSIFDDLATRKTGILDDLPVGKQPVAKVKTGNPSTSRVSQFVDDIDFNPTRKPLADKLDDGVRGNTSAKPTEVVTRKPSTARTGSGDKLDELKLNPADNTATRKPSTGAEKIEDLKLDPTKKPVERTPGRTVIENATSRKPVETPATKKPVVETTGTKKPVVETPTAKKPVVETTGTKKPVVETTGTRKPDVKPTAEKPAVKPTAEKPVVKPTAEKPVVKPTAEKPAVKPTAEKPVVKPTAEKPAVKPTAEKPVVETTGGKPADVVTRRPIDSTPVERVISATKSNAEDLVSVSTRQLTNSADEFSRTFDDVAKRAKLPAKPADAKVITDKLDEVRELTRQVASGTADDTAVARISQNLDDLKSAKVFTPDDAKAITTRLDDLSTRSNHTTVAREVVRSTTKAGDEFTNASRQLSTAADDFGRTFDDLASKAKLPTKPADAKVITDKFDEIREITRQVASGTADDTAMAKLNQNIADLRSAKVFTPDDARALTTKVDDLSTKANHTNVAREVARTTANSGDEFIQASKQLTTAADDFSRTFDDITTRVKLPAKPADAKVITDKLDEVRELTRQVTAGSADDTAIARLNQNIDDLRQARVFTPDDAKAITTSLDDMSTKARHTNVTREVARQTANTGDELANASRQLSTSADDFSRTFDDISKRAKLPAKPADAKVVTDKLDEVRELTRQVATGSADDTAIARITQNIDDLKQAKVFTPDDAQAITTKLDDVSTKAQHTNVAREVARTTANSGDQLTNASRLLSTSADDFGRTFDDIAQRAKLPAKPADAKVVTDKLDEVRELSRQVAAGTADDTAIIRINQNLDDLRSAKVFTADDARTLTNKVDDLSTKAQHTNVTREVARNTARTGEDFVNASKQLSTSADDFGRTFDDIAKRAKLPAKPADAKVLSDKFKEVRELTRQVAAGTADDTAVARISQNLDDLRSAKVFSPDDAKALTTKIDDLSTKAQHTNVAREVARNTARTGEEFVNASRLLSNSADDFGRTFDDIANRAKLPAKPADAKVITDKLDEVRELTRKIATGTADDTAVARISQNLDDLKSAKVIGADDAKALTSKLDDLTTKSQNTRVAREVARNTSRSGDELMRSTSTVSDSARTLSNNIQNLSTRARGARATQIADDLDVLDKVTKQIGNRTDTAASIRRAEEALNRLTATRRTPFADDIAKVVDDTKQLIKTSRHTGPTNLVKSTTDDLVKASDELSNVATRLRKPTTPKAVVRELDEISNAAKNIGRQGSDDAHQLNRIENSLRNLERTPQGRTVADQIRRSVEGVQTKALDVRRASKLKTVTDDAVNNANKLGNIARGSLNNPGNSRFVRRQLQEIADTADNINTSANPSVGIQSIERNVRNLKGLKDAKSVIPAGLERTVKELADNVKSANAIRRIDSSRDAVARISDAVARTADDGSLIAIGTKEPVTRILNYLKDDVTDLATTTSTRARTEIMKRVNNNLRSLRDTGNGRLANEIDEAMKLRNLEQVTAHNSRLASRIEVTAKSLEPAAAAKAGETTALASIETTAKQIASGRTTPNLIKALEDDIAKLSQSNRDALQPLLNELKSGATNHVNASRDVFEATAQIIADDLSTVSVKAFGRSSVSQNLDTIANVRQRVDLLSHVNGAETKVLANLRSGLVTLENGVLKLSQPGPLTRSTHWVGSKLGLTRNPGKYSIDGLSSTSSKISALAKEGNKVSGIDGAGKYLITQQPKLIASMATNTAILGGSLWLADRLLESHLERVVELAEQLKAEENTAKAMTDAPLRSVGESDEKASFLKANTEKPEIRQADERTDSAMDFSPALGAIARQAGFKNSRSDDALIDTIKRTGITGSAHEIEQARHDLRDTGKSRRWNSLASIAPASVEVAQTLFSNFRPVKFKEIEPDKKQPQSSFDRPAPGRFSITKIRRIMEQLGPKELAEGTKKTPLYGGSHSQSGTGLTNNLRTAGGTAYNSAQLLASGIEKSETKLDNLATASGGATQAPTTFTTYSAPSGLQFAKVDPNQTNAANNDDDEARDELYNEAVIEASDSTTV